MLNLTLRAGQYINIGDDIRVVFQGYEAGKLKIMVDAPKELRISRSANGDETYTPEQKMSREAQLEIAKIYKAERAKRKHKETIEARKKALRSQYEK